MEQSKDLNSALAAFIGTFTSMNHLPELRERLEKELADQPYQMMAVYQRNRHSTQKCERWPDRPVTARAVSKYPNILAELDASGFWLDRLARYAGVSMEIMAGVMEENGELSWKELRGAARCFECDVGYLMSPVLSMVDPATKNGTVRLRELRELLQQTEGKDGFYRRKALCELPTLEKGNPVTYAAYRHAVSDLQFILDQEARKEAEKQRIRTVTLSQKGEAPATLSERIQQAREREKDRKLRNRLNEMRKDVDGIETNGNGSIEDLQALAEFARYNLQGALSLAVAYGQARGYRSAAVNAGT